jgi:hypothetical protein
MPQKNFFFPMPFQNKLVCLSSAFFHANHMFAIGVSHMKVLHLLKNIQELLKRGWVKQRIRSP